MIKADAVGTASSVLILVATDCDSLCACKMLTVCNNFHFSFILRSSISNVSKKLLLNNEEGKKIIKTIFNIIIHRQY